MTPMIDVTFQLIVFFLVANDLSRKEIVDLDLPHALHATEDTPSGADRVIINLRRSRLGGTGAPIVSVRGRDLDLAQLTRELQTRADAVRPKGPGTPSELTALLRADENAPWSDVQHVMQACASPRVAVYRLQFAATLPDAARPAGR
ncbi:MAG: biopolymer transporter ExbD [Planctomycetes bacterium]|nr:biopolymer transporter ExbD [Planctomycetota bacterium]